MPDATLLPSVDGPMESIESARAACEAFGKLFTRLRTEIGLALVGQDDVVLHTLIALFADGHVLLEGVPGLGKTLLVRTLGETLQLPFSRIQFTPDLMPADITGTSVVVDDQQTGRRSFQFSPGPIFAQLVLADEINRATPKSQAALLEAMQEKSVTVAGSTHKLDRPFFVMATQNPIEQEGTYLLPEAQLDRFLFKVVVPYASRGEVNEIIDRTTRPNDTEVQPILDGETILRAQHLARRIVVAPLIQDYVIRLVMATHAGSPFALAELAPYIQVGVSPRGAQAILAGAKVAALIDGRFAVSFRDVHLVANAALRHRIVRSFEASADGVSTDDMVDKLIEALPRDPQDPQGDD